MAGWASDLHVRREGGEGGRELLVLRHTPHATREQLRAVQAHCGPAWGWTGSVMEALGSKRFIMPTGCNSRMCLLHTVCYLIEELILSVFL